jgi:hypothetical protein
MKASPLILLLAACGGGGSSAKDASAIDAPHIADAQGSLDGAMGDGPLVDGPLGDGPLIDGPLVDGPLVDGPLADAMLDAPPMPVLKVKNYLSWCSVTVNGGAASTLPEQDVTVAPGSIDVSAVAVAGFELGPAPWHDTIHDTGTGDPGTVTGSGQTASSATMAVVGASNKCVWVCCPFAVPAGSGCPTADQCP